MKKKGFFIFLVCLPLFVIYAGNLIEIEIPYFQRTVKIDGFLEPEEWSEAYQTNNFYQVQPGNNVQPSRKTVLYMFHNGSSLFIGIDCFDPDPENIERKRAKRDQFVQTDRIEIVFDPFFNAKQGYFLMIFVQNDVVDGTIIPSSGRASVDFNFDFKSKTKIDQNGWHLELEIPFNSIAIPQKSTQNWFFYLTRVVCRNDLIETINLSPADRNSNNPLEVEGYVILKFANLHQKRAKKVELIPALFVSAEKIESSDATLNNHKEVKPEVGLSGNYNFSSDAVMKFSINPDFSQIEADYLYSRINNRYPVYISEKRPFFLDGMESFSTPFTVLYTRKIVDPFLGLKFSLKKEDYGFYLLSSMERNVPLSRLGYREDENGDIFWNVFRFVIPSGKSSYLGGIATLRNSRDGYNYLFGVDGLQYLQRFTLKYQFLYSTTKFPDNREKSSNGSGGFLALSYKWNRLLSSRFTLAFLSPKYRCDSGFVSFNDYKMIETEFLFDYKPEKESGFLKSCKINLDAYKMIDYSGANIEKTINIDGSAVFPYKLNLNCSIYLSQEGFLNKDYNVYNVASEINYEGIKAFQPYFNYIFGQKIIYNPLNVRTANFRRAGSGFNLFIKNSSLKTNFFFEEYRELTSEKFVASQLAAQAIFYYFLSGSINLRLMLQYERTQLLDYAYKNSYFFYNFLFTYQKSAYSAIYLGISNQRSSDFLQDDERNVFYQEAFARNLSLFLKFQYSFKL